MTPDRPIIGITTHRHEFEGEMRIHPGYTESILRAGGVPVVLPMVSDADCYNDMVPLCDGFLLTGSEADVFPELYGKTPPENSFSDRWRDTQDYVILEHVQATGKPVFGICRGCQVMNVFRGGTLALHYGEVVTTDIGHDGDDGAGPPIHAVQMTATGSLATLAPTDTVMVNSLHRQVCERLGNRLRAAALSEDGLIEAIEDTAVPARYFAVQWHPERSPNGPDALSHALFQRFVEQSRLWQTDNR